MISQLTKIKYDLQTLKQKQTHINSELVTLESQLTDKNNELQQILEARQYYKKVIDIIYERSVEELKSILNSALSYIFDDRNFEIDVLITDKRGKSLTLVITENGKRANLKTGMGMSVKCVISAVLHMYYLQCKNSPILMLDEAYSNISKGYVPNFFNFVKQMCDKLGFKVIIITHDERFLDYGDKSYTFNQGRVTLNESRK